LNTLKISVSEQRISISSNSSSSTAKDKQSAIISIKVDNNSNDSKEKILSKIKINASDKYIEDRIELENWITQIETYFIFYSISVNRKILLASIFLRERTQYWLKLNLRKYFNNNSDFSEIFISFSIFKRELRQVFGIFNKKKIAKQVIQYLQQKISAADYTVRFQKYVNLANWNSIVLIAMFKQDLKNNIKNKLMRTDAKIDSIQILIEISISIDNRLYKQNIKKRYN